MDRDPSSSSSSSFVDGWGRGQAEAALAGYPAWRPRDSQLEDPAPGPEDPAPSSQPPERGPGDTRERQTPSADAWARWLPGPDFSYKIPLAGVVNVSQAQTHTLTDADTGSPALPGLRGDRDSID